MSSKNAASKGGTSAVHSSTLKLVKSSTSVGDAESSRYRNMVCASFHERHSITQIVMNSNVKRYVPEPDPAEDKREEDQRESDGEANEDSTEHDDQHDGSQRLGTHISMTSRLAQRRPV